MVRSPGYHPGPFARNTFLQVEDWLKADSGWAGDAALGRRGRLVGRRREVHFQAFVLGSGRFQADCISNLWPFIVPDREFKLL